MKFWERGMQRSAQLRHNEGRGGQVEAGEAGEADPTVGRGNSASGMSSLGERWGRGWTSGSGPSKPGCAGGSHQRVHSS